jgi:hypothetical protein
VVISPTLAPEAVGDSQSRTQASTKYTKVLNSHTHEADMLASMGNLRILLCPLWLYRHFASRAILPLGLLCLLGYFASWATLPLGLLCLLGYSASWATLPLGLASWATLPLGLASWATLPLGLLCLLGFLSALCLLGYVSSTLSALTMPVYCHASWAVPTLGTC